MSSLWKEEGAAPGKEAVLQALKQEARSKAKWESSDLQERGCLQAKTEQREERMCLNTWRFTLWLSVERSPRETEQIKNCGTSTHAWETLGYRGEIELDRTTWIS